MSTQALFLGGIAILLLLASSSSANATTLIGGAKPAGKVGGTRTFGAASPLPGQAPSGSPGASTQGGSVLGALYTNVLANSDKIGSGIADIITAARATDTGADEPAPAPATDVPPLANDAGSGATWIGFADALPPDGFAGAPTQTESFDQSSSFDQAVPDYAATESA